MIDWIEHLKDVNVVSRFFNKCLRIDARLESQGKKPVAFKAAQDCIKPLMPLPEQARNAEILEKAIDGLFNTTSADGKESPAMKAYKKLGSR
jgi:hypothetical protein